MTRHDLRLLDAIAAKINGMTARQALERLLELELLSSRNCERVAILANVETLTASGMGRCDAFQATAEAFCCSYEKVRGIYYKQYKP